MTVPRPQDTGSTTIEIATGDEVLDEGVTNGILSLLSGFPNHYTVEYDEQARRYFVLGVEENE